MTYKRFKRFKRIKMGAFRQRIPKESLELRPSLLDESGDCRLKVEISKSKSTSSIYPLQYDLGV